MGMANQVRRHARRSRLPLLERLETRELPSVVPVYMNHQAAQGRSSPAIPTGLDASANSTGQPTPHELARQHYVAKASGSFVTGPGRFSDQSLQGYINASGGSTHSFHIDLRMRFFVPTDRTKPVTGVATLTPRNVSTTGSTLVLELTAARGSATSGLPTHFTWTVSPSSGGLYTNAGGFGTGQGTLDVHYAPVGRVPRRAFGAGRAFVVVQGLVNVDGIFSDVGGLGNGE